MYIDDTVLTILFKSQGNTDLSTQIIKDYNNRIEQMALDVMKIYFTNTNIPKPRLKGIIDFMNLDPENMQEVSSNKLQYLYLNALQAAATTPEYTKLLETAINRFNESLYNNLLPDLLPDEKAKLDRYLASVESGLKKKEQILLQVIENAKQKTQTEAFDENLSK
jgi:hypothetical protein